MSTNWTQGPWQADCRGVRFTGYVHSNDLTGSAIAFTRFETVFRSEKKTLANAHLIAAAPELYEALNDALLVLRQIGGDKWALDKGMSALAKARGEQA